MRTPRPLPPVERHFGAGVVPTLTETFAPGRGWTPCRAERLGRARLRGLARHGVTSVAVTHDGRTADFRLAEFDRAELDAFWEDRGR